MQNTADVRPYVIRTYDRWIILVVVLVAGWFLFRPIFGFSVYYRGLSFERMLNLGEARYYYARATHVYPNNDLPWLALAVLQSMDGRIHAADYAAALSTLKNGLTNNPHSGALSFQMCRDYYEIGHDYPSAFSACARSVRDDPTNKFAWDYGAWAAHRSGDTRNAVVYWRRALRLDPTYAAAAQALSTAGH
ncbi:MAG TPA: tetratricopeptide repeat protein [Candidatus Eremiobacteraceae bacterium]